MTSQIKGDLETALLHLYLNHWYIMNHPFFFPRKYFSMRRNERNIFNYWKNYFNKKPNCHLLHLLSPFLWKVTTKILTRFPIHIFTDSNEPLLHRFDHISFFSFLLFPTTLKLHLRVLAGIDKCTATNLQNQIKILNQGEYIYFEMYYETLAFICKEFLPICQYLWSIRLLHPN